MLRKICHHVYMYVFISMWLNCMVVVICKLFLNSRHYRRGTIANNTWCFILNKRLVSIFSIQYLFFLWLIWLIWFSSNFMFSTQHMVKMYQKINPAQFHYREKVDEGGVITSPYLIAAGRKPFPKRYAILHTEIHKMIMNCLFMTVLRIIVDIILYLTFPIFLLHRPTMFEIIWLKIYIFFYIKLFPNFLMMLYSNFLILSFWLISFRYWKLKDEEEMTL